MRILAIALAFIVLVNTPIFAAICPSIQAIKAKQFNGWQVFDSEEKRLISTNRFLHFKESIKEFALAEWEQEGAIHCYYRDRQGSNLSIYLMKNNFVPDNTKNYWYRVSGYRECAASMERCQFKPIPQTYARR